MRDLVDRRWPKYRGRIKRAILRGQFGAAMKLVDFMWPDDGTMGRDKQRQFISSAVKSMARRMREGNTAQRENVQKERGE